MLSCRDVVLGTKVSHDCGGCAFSGVVVGIHEKEGEISVQVTEVRKSASYLKLTGVERMPVSIFWVLEYPEGSNLISIKIRYLHQRQEFYKKYKDKLPNWRFDDGF